VPTITLDAPFDHFGPPTLVKIDVEVAGYRLTKAAEMNWLAERGPFSQS